MLTRSPVVSRSWRWGVIPLGGRLDVDLVCGISCRGRGRTNLVVAIGRNGLLVAISGALGRRGLLVAVTLGTWGLQCQRLMSPAVQGWWRVRIVAGVLLLRRGSVSSSVVARRVSRHIQTDSRQQDRIRSGVEGRSDGRAAGDGLAKRTGGGVERRGWKGAGGKGGQ